MTRQAAVVFLFCLAADFCFHLTAGYFYVILLPMEKLYNLESYNYTLPERLIAQTPPEKRGDSRLLVLYKDSGKIEDRMFREIPLLLPKQSCLVMNDTKVLPARLFGVTKKTGAKIEILLLNEKENNLHEVMMKNSRRVKEGDEIEFDSGLIFRVAEKHGKTVTGGFNRSGEALYCVFRERGTIPLPPYITQDTDSALHKERYQTVYAKKEGAKAAPTAGLHFTGQILAEIKNQGITTAPVTLHVGLGTFEAVSESDIRNHKMHSEYYEIAKSSADIINAAVSNGKTVTAAGTTSLRTLESACVNGKIKEGSGSTSIYICPGYEFKAVNALITNFHLPKTSLLALACAFAGYDYIMKAYSHAVNKEYRFFSYGDAMLII